MNPDSIADKLTAFPMSYADEAADKLRTLESINSDLVEALKDMVAGFRLIADEDYPALARARAALNKAGVT